MMISNKAKERPMMITSHRIQSMRIANRIRAVPEEKRKPEERRFLSDFDTEEKGIIIGGEVQAQRLDAQKQAAVDAEVNRLLSFRAENGREGGEVQVNESVENDESSIDEKPKPKVKAKAVKKDGKQKATAKKK
jgi:hypothetical protein